jgi:6-phosphogluconolactonase
MQLHVYKNVDELSQAAAAWIANLITETLTQKGRFTIVLSGGSTPQKLHNILANTPYKQNIEWSKVHFFWGDERDVPFEDNRNNAKMAYDTLLNHVPVPAHHIHIIHTNIDAAASATAYEARLKRYFPIDAALITTFDLVLLGMGDDGHTLSLFPGTPVIHEQEKWVTSFYLEAQQMNRITLTAPIVNRAANIAFLTAGANKAVVLKEVLEGEYNPDKYPSQIIKPVTGNVHWFIDEAAAAKLSSV